MGNKTALHSKHLDAGARMVDFGGWEMPLHYGSQIEEHHQVRRGAGMFDVSHMTVVDVTGPDARDYLRRLLANDVARLQRKGKALYSAMLNDQGGIIDDLIVYLMTEAGVSGEWYRVVVNCATREQDLRWMAEQAARMDVALTEQPELAMIAVQGPDTLARVKAQVSDYRAALIDELDVFQGQESEGWFIARTGYTGEEGLEIMLPEDEAADLWQALLDAGVAPCGLGARDSLRLEAGMNLYGQDMDESVTPLQSNMAWTLAWEPVERRFIGREALEAQRSAGVPDLLTGLVLEGRGVLRNGQRVQLPDGGEGVITSGGFSPTLGYAVAMVRVPAGAEGEAEVEMRGKRVKVRLVKLPFVRHGARVHA